MENPIFKKLQEAVEHPSRSKEWFGMAEQSINTIYALGEHPDALCNTIIKNLTRRAFALKPKKTPVPEKTPEAMDQDQPADEKTEDGDVANMTEDGSVQSEEDKDIGDVFELSQLLFVVGHVAIKHIVFLELVEREWKRQKDEKTASEYIILINVCPTDIVSIYQGKSSLPLTVATERARKGKNLIKSLAMLRMRLETE